MKVQTYPQEVVYLQIASFAAVDRPLRDSKLRGKISVPITIPRSALRFSVSLHGSKIQTELQIHSQLFCTPCRIYVAP